MHVHARKLTSNEICSDPRWQLGNVSARTPRMCFKSTVQSGERDSFDLLCFVYSSLKAHKAMQKNNIHVAFRHCTTG